MSWHCHTPLPFLWAPTYISCCMISIILYDSDSNLPLIKARTAALLSSRFSSVRIADLNGFWHLHNWSSGIYIRPRCRLSLSVFTLKFMCATGMLLLDMAVSSISSHFYFVVIIIYWCVLSEAGLQNWNCNSFRFSTLFKIR